MQIPNGRCISEGIEIEKERQVQREEQGVAAV